MLYRLERVHKSFGARTVLAGATWQHDPGRVAGLVGRNGAGKSTLLRIVQGLVEPDAGRVLLAGGTTFASLEQAVEPEGDEPLREFVARAQEGLRGLETEMRRLEVAIASSSAAMAADAVEPLLAEHDALRERFERNGGYEADARVERVLLGVGLPRETWDRPVGELSGGQKHRAQMARLLLGDASVLLLDEPTNHLDVAGLEFLETWLVERKNAAAQAALVVSHDRQFLNAVADRIVEVAHGVLEEYPGDYDAYRKLKAERDRVRAKAAEEQKKLVERTEDFIRRNIAGQKTRQAQSRRKMLARLERVEAPREDANDVLFRFEEARASGDRVLELRGLVPGYPETGPLLRAGLLPPPARGADRALGAERLREDDSPEDDCANPGRRSRAARFRGRASSSATTIRRCATSRPPGRSSTSFATSTRASSTARRATSSPSSTSEATRWSRRWGPSREERRGASRSPESSSAVRTCSCSTSRRTTSTSTRASGSRRRSSSSRGRSSSSPTTAGSSTGSRRTSSRCRGARRHSGPGASPSSRGGGPRRRPWRWLPHGPSTADAGPKPLRRPDRQADRQRAKARREVEALEEEVSRLEERIREIDAALADPSAWKDGPRTRELTLSRDETRQALDARCAAWEEAVQKLEQEVPA